MTLKRLRTSVIMISSHLSAKSNNFHCERLQNNFKEAEMISDNIHDSKNIKKFGLHLKFKQFLFCWTISLVWNINEKGKTDPIQNLILYKKKTNICHFVLLLSSLCFCIFYCLNCLFSQVLHSWSLTLKFCSIHLVIASSITVISCQINLFVYQLSATYI